jgi:mRNA-degrading endonuclease RelE of RelBE toxin-antitoxin system
MSWSLVWTSRSLKDLRKIDGQIRSRIVAAVERYANSGAGDVLQLTAIDPPEYRLRVGDWRVRFRREPAQNALVILVLRVLPRDKAY